MPALRTPPATALSVGQMIAPAGTQPARPALAPVVDLACGHEFRAACPPYRDDLVYCRRCDDWQPVVSGRPKGYDARRRRRPEPEPEPELADIGACTDTLAVVIGDVVPALVVRSHTRGGRPSVVHLTVAVPVRQPPRGRKSGTWYIRDPGDPLCKVWPGAFRRITVPAPPGTAVTCTECLAIAGERGLAAS